MLKTKLANAGIESSALAHFSRVLDLNNIPDVGLLVAKGGMSPADLWKLRQARESRQFRAWLRTANVGDARELEQAFVSSLTSSDASSSLPVKMLRFVITTGVGTLFPPAGIVLDAIDSFFVDKWLQGYSPRLFLDSLSRLASDS